jgi:hypothetical protein
MKIYHALHNPDSFDSCAATISIHRTKEGAERAVKNSKRRVKYDDDKMYEAGEVREFKWDFGHWWGVLEDELKD